MSLKENDVIAEQQMEMAEEKPPTSPPKARLSKKYKDLTALATAVHQNMSVPRELALIYLEISAMYGYYSDQMKDIQISKPAKWLQIKESGDDKDISDSKADKLYAMTDEGRKEIELKYTLRALEKLAGAIKNCSFLNNNEAKNEY